MDIACERGSRKLLLALGSKCRWGVHLPSYNADGVETCTPKLRSLWRDLGKMCLLQSDFLWEVRCQGLSPNTCVVPFEINFLLELQARAVVATLGSPVARAITAKFSQEKRILDTEPSLYGPLKLLVLT